MGAWDFVMLTDENIVLEHEGKIYTWGSSSKTIGVPITPYKEDTISMSKNIYIESMAKRMEVLFDRKDFGIGTVGIRRNIVSISTYNYPKDSDIIQSVDLKIVFNNEIKSDFIHMRSYSAWLNDLTSKLKTIFDIKNLGDPVKDDNGVIRWSIGDEDAVNILKPYKLVESMQTNRLF